MIHPPTPGVTTRCKITRVIDGDTVDVQVTYPLRVRLKDCWAGELSTVSGEEASEALKQRVKQSMTGDAILLVPTGQAHNAMDVFTFGRVLGVLWLAHEPQSLNEWMIANGYATAQKQR